MNRDHLGDALDHWKGDLITRLEGAGAASEFRVLPMFTDAPWPHPELEVYGRLLRRGSAHSVLLPDVPFDRTRTTNYFEQANQLWAGDVFVDPNTGIGRSGGGDTLRRAEIQVLLAPDGDDSSQRLVMIYQHGQRRDAKQTFQEWEKRVAPLKTQSCFLLSGQAGVVFLSNIPKRIDAVRNFLVQQLGPVAARRVR